MQTPPMPALKQNGEVAVREAALKRLREGKNPFAFSVATAGTQDSCRDYDVPALLDSQRADLLAIVDLYRHQHQPSQVFPVLGDTGTGKTHLLTILQAELQKEAVDSGKESLLLVADHFSVGVDAVDFFFWQIINHLLAGEGPGARLLQVISKRVTARLLAEALRQLSPHQQAQLIPTQGVWERMKTWLGSAAATRARLERIRDLITRCDVPSGVEPRAACEEAGLPLPEAVTLTSAHLERTEPNDASGALRRALYSRLVGFTLLNENEALQDYLTDGFLEGPAYVKGAGQLTRRMLTVLLQLLHTLRIPVIVVFDQLEDYLRAPVQEREQELRDTFSQALAALVNNVAGLGLVVFAEQALWNAVILAGSARYAQARLDQEFNLPGRPARRALTMPDRVHSKYLVELVQRRVRSALGDFNSTGLPPYFPFDESQLRELEKEPTIRACLRKLSGWYNETVFSTSTPVSPPPRTTPAPPVPPLPPPVQERLAQQLRLRWETELAGARKIIQGNAPRPSLIPQVQNALFYWLTYLREQGIMSAATWAKVELVEDSNKGAYGYLTVIRPENPNTPGIGIAAWLAGNRGRAKELGCRLGFFDKVPCPVRTLALCREDGEAALRGDTKDVYDKAVKKGRDVRIQAYQPRHLEALLAFPSWLPAISPEVQAAGLEGAAVLKQFVSKLSKELLDWIDAWRQPAHGGQR
jgi:hypothetical protein